MLANGGKRKGEEQEGGERRGKARLGNGLGKKKGDGEKSKNLGTAKCTRKKDSRGENGSQTAMARNGSFISLSFRIFTFSPLSL